MRPSDTLCKDPQSMGDNSVSPKTTLSYLALVFLSLLALELIPLDISRLHSNHPRPVVLISNTISSEVGINRVRDSTLVLNTTKEDSVTLSDQNIRSFFDSLKQEAYLWKDKRRLPIIRYYTKADDSSKVFYMRKYGYYIHERPSSAYDDYASNSIHYGDSVSELDLLLLGHHLIESGISVQNISLSKYHDDWKSKAIEVGTDTTIFDQKPFTLENLLEKFHVQ